MGLACAMIFFPGTALGGTERVCRAVVEGVVYKLSVTMSNSRVDGIRYQSVTTDNGVDCDLDASRTSASEWREEGLSTHFTVNVGRDDKASPALLHGRVVINKGEVRVNLENLNTADIYIGLCGMGGYLASAVTPPRTGTRCEVTP
jgi:hypothetical protein